MICAKGDRMNKVIKKYISLVTAIMLVATSLIFLPASANAETAPGKIHSLVPKVEQYYSGIENYIADCLRKNMSNIDITFFHVSVENVPHVYKSAVFTNPDIFFVDATFLRYQFDSDGIVHYITPKYIVKKSSIPKYIKRFNKAVKNFLNGIDIGLTDFRKALIIHDKMIVDYQYKSIGDLSYTAYGALVNKKAVCEGYTRAYCYLLSKVGIESKCINIEKKAHCWNFVKVNGCWYHVDVTSDDPMPDTCGYVSHKYFLISDSKLSSYKSKEHTGYKHDVTYKTNYKCSDKKYNSSFFRRINSEIFFLNNTYYFINNNYKNKHISALISRRNSRNKAVAIISDMWFNKNGNIFNSSFSKLCCLDGMIYFNSKRVIYRYNPNSGKIRKVFAMPDFWYNDFYGIKSSGRYILADKKKSELTKTGKTKILYIRKDKSVLQLPFVRRNTVRIQQKKKYTFRVYRGSGAVRYKSSDRRIATVNSKGVVKAKKRGICTITAVKNSKTFRLRITVIKIQKNKRIVL